MARTWMINVTSEKNLGVGSGIEAANAYSTIAT